MKCGNCGGMNAEYFDWLGVVSVRCPDCGADLMPGVDLTEDQTPPADVHSTGKE